MKDYIASIKITLETLENELGGDVTFLKPTNMDELHDFEISINWELPDVFKYFYTQETNGIIIDNKRIYGFYDKDQKKTWVENLLRMNNPDISPWFNGRPHIFNDYLVIGNDDKIIFCLSKKYNLPNPSLYICKNSNSQHGVDLNKLDMDLESLILGMVREAFK